VRGGPLVGAPAAQPERAAHQGPAAVRAGCDGDQRAVAARLDREQGPRPLRPPHATRSDPRAAYRGAVIEELTVGARVELRVGPPAHGGHCVSRVDGQVVFVRHALPGERVVATVTEVTRSFCRADAVDILDAAPGRVAQPCPFARPDLCGGCDLQHAAGPAQREWKATVVREQLARLAGLTEVD